MCSIIQSQFWTVVAIPLGITLVGAFFGAWLGMKFFNRQASEEFKKERADILKALLQSLEDNHKYIKQIEEVHFPNNQFPSYPMDTEALSFLALNARKYLDKDRNWSQKIKKEAPSLQRGEEFLLS